MKNRAVLFVCFSFLSLSASDEGRHIPYGNYINDNQKVRCQALLGVKDLSTKTLWEQQVILEEELTSLERSKEKTGLCDQRILSRTIAKNIILKLLGKDSTNAHNFDEALFALGRAKVKEAFLTKSTPKTERAVSCPHHVASPVTFATGDEDNDQASAELEAAIRRTTLSTTRRSSSCPEPVKKPRVPTPAPFAVNRMLSIPEPDNSILPSENLDTPLTA